MRYVWRFISEHPIVLFELTELDGLCETSYEVDGGWQCQGNGMLTVIRKLLELGYAPSNVREL